MFESAPPNPNNEKLPEDQPSSRRSFLRKALGATGALAIGAVGGIAGNKAEQQFKGQVSQEQSVVNPVQEAVNQRYSKLVEAIGNGDQEIIQVATELLNSHMEELKLQKNNHTVLQNRLTSSKPNEGLRSLIENELQFNKERQEWLLGIIRSLKDPINNYLESQKQNRGGGSDKMQTDKGAFGKPGKVLM